ncbi:MAG: hypothetical protein GY742_21960 [Hyphomicrobiales bacterium]|nr:hypothetical protein [Hyphomicrobiales bacterium]
MKLNYVNHCIPPMSQVKSCCAMQLDIETSRKSGSGAFVTFLINRSEAGVLAAYDIGQNGLQADLASNQRLHPVVESVQCARRKIGRYRCILLSREFLWFSLPQKPLAKPCGFCSVFATLE